MLRPIASSPPSLPVARLRRASVAVLSFAVGAVFAGTLGCGPTDTIKAFDVVLETTSDCSQVGVGAVQCEDEAVLREKKTLGRWVIDERGQDSIVLTTHLGRVIPGLYFNNTDPISEECTGEGGVCYFARARVDEIDVESNCIEIQQRALDSVFDPTEGTLRGTFSEIILTDENCGTPFVQEVLVEVEGTLVDEAVLAREVY